MRLASAVLIAVLAVPAAFGQDYPSKPIRIINPFPPGGGMDLLLRPLAQRMSESMKATIVVENRAGANGAIGTEFVAIAPPDGYTLLAGTTGALPMNAALKTNLPYDPVRSFAPISNFAESAFILSVHPSVPAHSVQEFIALAKARPGAVSYGSFGIGSSSHFGAELFSQQAGVTLLHVPYKGSAPSLAALLAGEIMASFDSMQAVMPHVRAQRLRALGIGAKRRSPAAPDLPTIAEAGLPGFEVGSWYGLLAPAGTARETVMKLHAEVVKALGAPDLRERFASVGTELVGNTPEEFGEQIRSDFVKWAEVVRTAKIVVE